MELHIAIAIDSNYLHQFYALITSIFGNNKKNHIVLHVIVTGVAEADVEKIKVYVRESGAEINFYAIDESFVKKFILISKWTTAVYYRLFFPLLIPRNVHRFLYLDADTLVLQDLSGLFTVSLDGMPLGAVYDNYVKNQPLLNIHEEGEYFNSGVLLVDAPLWRTQEISEKAINYLTSYPERIQFVDQCALNAVLYGNWKKLPEKFNLLYSYIPDPISSDRLKDFMSDKVIVHFTLQRPWSMLGKSRLNYLYFRYLKMSPAGKSATRFTDFKWRQLPHFVKLKLLHFYFDVPSLQRLWQKIKNANR